MGFTPDPAGLMETTGPEVGERLKKKGIDGVVIGTTSPLGHQSGGLITRAIESVGIPTVVVMVDRQKAATLAVVRCLNSSLGTPLVVLSMRISNGWSWKTR